MRISKKRAQVGIISKIENAEIEMRFNITVKGKRGVEEYTKILDDLVLMMELVYNQYQI